MTSNHTTEPSEEDREMLAAEIEAEGITEAHEKRRAGSWHDGPGHTKRLEDAALRAIAKARALSPSPDDRMGEAIAPVAQPEKERG